MEVRRCTEDSGPPQPLSLQGIQDRHEGVRPHTPALSARLPDDRVKHPPSDALGAILDDWEAQHGALTPDELARAEDELKPLPSEPCQEKPSSL
jgi:hypothetical protein